MAADFVLRFLEMARLYAAAPWVTWYISHCLAYLSNLATLIISGNRNAIITAATPANVTGYDIPYTYETIALAIVGGDMQS